MWEMRQEKEGCYDFIKECRGCYGLHYFYTLKENNREEIFANIDCVDSDGDKHKIKMKVDTRANGNIIPFRIYKKIYPRYVSSKMGKPTAIRREITTRWAVNGTKIPQYGSVILKIKHKDSPIIQAKFYKCEDDTTLT